MRLIFDLNVNISLFYIVPIHIPIRDRFYKYVTAALMICHGGQAICAQQPLTERLVFQSKQKA
jgi:hypothetical protein